jgi:hypothetical protein
MTTVAIALLMAASQSPALLRWNPKQGAIREYMLTTMVRESSLDTSDVVYTGVWRVQFKEVTESDVVLTEQVVQRRRFDRADESGQGIVMQDLPPSERVIKRNGEPFYPAGIRPPPDAIRLNDATILIYPEKPVKPGDQWTRERSGDGAPQRKTVFTFTGVEGSGASAAHVVKSKHTESGGARPMTAECTFWISVSDGCLVKFEANATDAPRAVLYRTSCVLKSSS